MAVGGVGIERDVGQHADLGHRILDRLDRLADQIVGVERLARIALRRSCGVLGNSAMQGMPRSRASLARSAIRSTDQRDTPGRVAIGSSTPCPR